MRKAENRVGQIFNGWLVLDYINNKIMTVQNVETGTVKTGMRLSNILAGSIKDYNQKSVCGVGFIGEGKHVPSVNGKLSKEFALWRGMIKRCYGGSKFYADVEVCERWHCFQNFADDLPSLPNYAEWLNADGERWELDKDGLSQSRTYSPETCQFLTQAENLAIRNSKAH
ncbi:hypothetical protein RN298_004696 [Salmonella enterica]|nr:hypothetical protein [Salmonella enterica]